MSKNSYNPYSDVNAIYNYKGQYDEAMNSGNSMKAQEIAKAAQQNYNNLKSNDYDDVAKSLADVGYAGAKKIRDKYAMEGKVAIRPYLYNSKLKTKYGMSDADIDKALSFNETTGEVYLGGMNLGSPYSNVDGTTYWDSTVLDKGIDDYISHSGITPSKTELVNQNNAGVLEKTNALNDLQMSDRKEMSGKYGELYDKAMYENPFETPTGQSIMNEYKLKGAQASDNAKAEGGASNSGNIDSYAAANALRQQAAMTSKGQQMAIAAQTEAINNVRGVLGDMGGYQLASNESIQKTIELQQNEGSRLFEEQQTEKLNENQIGYNVAAVTGYVPNSYNRETNMYFTNGTLTNPNLDYGVIIEDTENKLKTESDPEQRKLLQKQLNDAIYARSYKTSPDNYGGKYSKYADSMYGYYPTKTLTRDTSEAESNLKKYVADTEAALEREKNESSKNGEEDEEMVEVVDLGTFRNNFSDSTERKKILDENQVSYIGGYWSQGARDWGADYGLNAINALLEHFKNKAFVDAEDVKEWLVNNSEKNNTDKREVAAISRALGIGDSWLNNYENVGKGIQRIS